MFGWFKKKTEKFNHFPLVWNDDKIALATADSNEDYEFENFTGYIRLYDDECFVENADFVYHIGNMNYLKGTASPIRPFDIKVNNINKFQGVIKGGVLRCNILADTIVNGGKVYCKRASNIILNLGEIVCNEWERGNVNGGILNCKHWKCGSFNNVVFNGCKWSQGHFIDGEFNGNWYGGKWKDGKFNGVSFVGDGSFNSIEKF